MNSPMLRIDELSKEEAEQLDLDTSDGARWKLVTVAIKMNDNESTNLAS